MITVKIIPNEKGTPVGKLADVELHFTHTIGEAGALQNEPADVHFADAILNGLKLVGFAVWERHSGNKRNVTFPARMYTINREQRSFALLRPITDAHAQEQIRDLILDAYAEYERETATVQS